MKIFNKIKNLFKKEEIKEQTIGESIESYAAKAKWDDVSGELTVDGSIHLPYTKQIWFGDPDLLSPIIESHNFGVDADEDVRYFTEKMKEESKISFSDFDKIGESIKKTDERAKDLYYKNLYENAEKTLFQMKKIKRANEKVVEKIMKYEENRIKAQPAFKSTIHGK